MKTTEIYQKCQELKELLATIEKYTDTPVDLVETVANAEMNAAGVISQIEDMALSINPTKNPYKTTYPDAAAFNHFHGITKREYFAAMAMQGCIASDHDVQYGFRQIAEFAVGQADALIEKLNKE